MDPITVASQQPVRSTLSGQDFNALLRATAHAPTSGADRLHAELTAQSGPVSPDQTVCVEFYGSDYTVAHNSLLYARRYDITTRMSAASELPAPLAACA